MTKPDDVTQEAWDAAELLTKRILIDITAGQLWDIQPTIARALASARGQETERCVSRAAAWIDSFISGMNKTATFDDLAAAIRQRGQS